MQLVQEKIALALSRGFGPYWIDSKFWADAQLIHDPQFNLAILTRSENKWQALNEILNSNFKSSSMVFEQGSNPLLIAAELDFFLDLHSPDAKKFYEDVTNVALNFLQISRTRYIGIKLERVDFDNCSSFHVDFVNLRLICTYSGPGTEWLRNDDVNRAGLGKSDNSLVAKPSAIIQQIPTQHIAILKGDRFPGASGYGLVHRSPQISKTKESRLLLRIDAVES